MEKKKYLSILFLSMLIMLFFVSVSWAMNSSWSDRSYNFRSVKCIILNDVKCDIENMDDLQLKRIEDRCWDGAESTKLIVLDRRTAKMKVAQMAGISDITSKDMKEAWEIYLPQIAQLVIVPKLEKYKYWNRHKPAYTSMEEQTRKETIKGPNGQKIVRTWTETVPVYHPATDEANFAVKMTFKVFDTVTKQEVMIRTDERSKATNDPIGMLKRMSQEFFKDLKKNLKKKK